MSKWLMLASVCLCSFVFLNAVQAADGDPTGTWKWSNTFGERTFESTLTLKLEGDKLSGAMAGRGNQETAIEDATFKDGTVSFKLTRERNGRKSTSSYSGKFEGDTITGKIESDRGGKTNSRDWTAKRAK